eukprot:c1555_g1_i1.p1 GENE.c1555_g1_i1~~c1555_g1_i1.p1  ORF type:complete len:531 (+),score=140.60 c1555_g1_i1:56-1594(+)
MRTHLIAACTVLLPFVYASDDKCEETKHGEEGRLAITIALLCIAVSFSISFWGELKKLTMLPEAVIAVMVGLIFSGTFYAIWGDQTEVIALMKFDKDFFFLWLLPPIIFEAGYNMERKEFFENIGATIMYAFVGTLISTFVIGGIVYGAGAAGLCFNLGPLPSLVFGSLISATDPVTVLAVFQSLGVDIHLFSMVFGESVLNDAVAVVLYRTLVGFKCHTLSASSTFAAIGLFLEIFVFSLLIGLGFGLFSAVITKMWGLRHHQGHHVMEGCLITLFAWASYFFADSFEFSGIVAILFCGITMSHYSFENLSDAAKVLTRDMFKVVAKLAEVFVFLYLGMSVFAFHLDDGSLAMTHNLNFPLALIAIIACLFGRLCNIIPLTWLINKFRDNDRQISKAHVFFLWFSGLRGGMAFAIAAAVFGEDEFPERDVGLAILQVTLLVSVFTIVVMGCSVTKLATYFDVLGTKKAASPMDAASPLPVRHKHIRRLLEFDRKVLKPNLTVRKSHHRVPM